MKMSKMIDLKGQRFNRLIAIKPLPKDPNIKDRSIKWLCECDCGNEIAVSGSNLRTGHTKSCGCLQKETTHNRIKDISNKKYGLLTAVEIDKERSKKKAHTYWQCKCECGSIISVALPSLERGLTKSCGCLKQSYGTLLIDKILNENNIPFKKEYYCKDNNGNKFYFDYLIDNKYIIEFDGQQHFQSTAGWNSHEQVLKNHQKDLIKNNYCFNNNLQIIRIPYIIQNNISVNDLFLETSSFILTRENEKDYYLKYYKEKER